MSALGGIGTVIGFVCICVSMISVLFPQKRMRRIFGFVIGLFFILTLVLGVSSAVKDIRVNLPEPDKITNPQYSEKDYHDAVGKKTAEQLAGALKELLENEGITVDDISISLKISDQGRITVSRAVIYISEAYAGRVGDVRRIVYRNVSKEPEIYVEGKKAE